MQSSPFPYYLIPLRFRCLPQHPHETAGKNVIPCILIFIFWDRKKKIILKIICASSSLNIHHIIKLFKLKLQILKNYLLYAMCLYMCNTARELFMRKPVTLR